MKCAKFSSQPIRDFMAIDKLLELTPTKVNDSSLRHGENVELKLSLDYTPFNKLMEKFEQLSAEHPEFQLFNTELVKDGYIKVPRNIVKN